MRAEYLACRDLGHAWASGTTSLAVEPLVGIRPGLTRLAKAAGADAVLVRTLTCRCGVSRVDEFVLVGSQGHYTVGRQIGRRMSYRAAPGYLQEPGERRTRSDFRTEALQVALDRSARAPRKARLASA